MKIIVMLLSILTLILSRWFVVPNFFWIFVFPIVFCVITVYINKYKRRISYYNDFPNVLRVFFGCLGGVLLSFYDIFRVILGLLFVLFGILANDEAMRRVYRNRGLIVLSGIDGTGKSTHAENIRSWLEQNGIRCKIVPFHRYVFLDKLSRFRLRFHKEGRMMKTGEKSPPRGWIPAKTSKFSFIRPYIALIDNFFLYLIRVVPSICRRKYVICDRFIWDNYVKHKMLGYNTRYLFELSTVIKPKIGMIFDVPSEVAVERVSGREFHYQYTKEQYDVERVEFKKIAKKLNYPIINTDKPPEQTWSDIIEYLTKIIRNNSNNTQS